MIRREFITLLGGAAAAWPLAARAQQAAQVRRIGVLMPFAEDHPVGQARNAAFLQGLQQLGWTDGRNVRIDYRWSAGDGDRIRKFATELIALGPEVVMCLTEGLRLGAAVYKRLRRGRLFERQFAV
jgi:DNA-binding LacI/PurR family transcriptional regulator